MNLCKVSAVLMGLAIICVDGSSDFSSQNLSTRFSVSPTATAPSLYPSSTQTHPSHSNAGATISASPYPPQPYDQTQTSLNYSNGAISTSSQPSSTIIGQTQTTPTHSHETISTLPFLPQPSSTIDQIQTTPIHSADITAAQSQVTPSQTEAKTVVPTTTGITSYTQQQEPTPLPPPTDTCSLCPVTSHSMRATDVTPTPTDMVQPGTQYLTTSSATPSIMLPIWGWVTVVVGGLFVFSSCAIFFTVCFCLRMRNKRSADNYQQRSSRRQSVDSIDNRTPESATSTMEMIYPTEESGGKDFKKGHPVSRWDSLRESWSRRSSRRKFSTFKPQLYNQDKLPVADSKELQPSAPLGTTTTTTFGSQSASTLNTNIPETSANKLSSVSGHFVKEKYQSSPKAEPGYKCPPPSNPYYSSQDSVPNNFSTSLNYCKNQVFVSNPNYGNSDFQAPLPILSNQTSASADLGGLNYQNFATNPAGSHRTSTRQATPMSSGYNDSAYLRTQANPPGYGVYGYQHALPNPSYNNNVDRGGTTPNNDTNDDTNGYQNPHFDTALGRQTRHTELGRGSLAFDRKSTSFH